ncbi:GNAT family N-acetyltransferase [Bacillus sp. 2205SS5-2]|uniref:GNAT family N-acetyltransferase n=1 Tax=Bacillus sp. 2205SS5-2 TaxID=3109031 RepID=UPI003004AE0D
MLIRYKKAFEKIAMGLLSFMPNEKDLKKLQETMKFYENEKSWRLYLWKDEDVIGLVGVQIISDLIVVQHISVNPSHRHEGIGTRMLKALHDLYTDYTIQPTEETASFVDNRNVEEA